MMNNNTAEYEKRSYEDLSSEFKKLYPSAVRAFELIPLMYNRLTLVDKLSHKEAMTKIYNDHRQLSGFSPRNIRRYLPLDNPAVARRFRPSCPKNSITKDTEDPILSINEHKQSEGDEVSNRSSTSASSSTILGKENHIIDTDTLPFEFSLPSEDVWRYMIESLAEDQICFNGILDKRTHKVISAAIGRASSQQSTTTERV